MELRMDQIKKTRKYKGRKLTYFFPRGKMITSPQFHILRRDRLKYVMFVMEHMNELSDSHLDITSVSSISMKVMMVAYRYKSREKLCSIIVSLESSALQQHFTESFKGKKASSLSITAHFIQDSTLDKMRPQQLAIQRALGATTRNMEPGPHYFQYAQPSWHTPQILLWTEIRIFLNIFETHIHEMNPKRRGYLGTLMTAATFFMTMKKAYEKYRKCIAHRQVNSSQRNQGWNKGDVKLVTEDAT